MVLKGNTSEHPIIIILYITFYTVQKEKFVCLSLILEIHACNNPSPVFKRCLLSAVASTSSQGVCDVR